MIHARRQPRLVDEHLYGFAIAEEVLLDGLQHNQLAKTTYPACDTGADHGRPTPAQLHQDVVLLRNVDFVAGTRRVRVRIFVELRAHHCTIIAGHQESIRTTSRSAQWGGITAYRSSY